MVRDLYVTGKRVGTEKRVGSGFYRDPSRNSLADSMCSAGVLCREPLYSLGMTYLNTGDKVLPKHEWTNVLVGSNYLLTCFKMLGSLPCALNKS